MLSTPDVIVLIIIGFAIYLIAVGNGKEKALKAVIVWAVITIGLSYAAYAIINFATSSIIIVATSDKEVIWTKKAGVFEMLGNCGLPPAITNERAKSEKKLFVWFDGARESFVLEQDETLSGQVGILRLPRFAQEWCKCSFEIKFSKPLPGT